MVNNYLEVELYVKGHTLQYAQKDVLATTKLPLYVIHIFNELLFVVFLNEVLFFSFCRDPYLPATSVCACVVNPNITACHAARSRSPSKVRQRRFQIPRLFE